MQMGKGKKRKILIKKMKSKSASPRCFEEQHSL